VAGTGRAGTTLLVRFLSELGYDAGAEGEVGPYLAEVRAGLESHPREGWSADRIAALPFVLKDPRLSDPRLLRGAVRAGLRLRAVLCPVRDLGGAARSRLSRGLAWVPPEGEPDVLLRPGPPPSEAEQRAHLARVLGELVAHCTVSEVPLVLFDWEVLVSWGAKEAAPTLTRLLGGVLPGLDSAWPGDVREALLRARAAA
jgi:hypothetical protein